MVRELGQPEQIHAAGCFHVGRIPPVVVVHRPEPIGDGERAEVVVVRLLEVRGLLEHRALALPSKLSAVALGRRQVLPRALIQPSVHRVVLPVTVLAHDAGTVLLAPTAAVLPRVEVDIVAMDPSRGETLVAGILLMRDRVGSGDELRRHGRFVERHFPQRHARVVAVPAHEVAAVLVLQGDERRVRIEVLPARDAVHHHQAAARRRRP